MSPLLKPLPPRAKTVFDLATVAVAVFSALIAVGAVASSLIAGNLPGEPLAPLSRVTLCMIAPQDGLQQPAFVTVPESTRVSDVVPVDHVRH